MVIKSAFLLKREMSSSDANVIVAWNNTSAAINRYFSIFIFLFWDSWKYSQLSGLTARMLSGWAGDLTNTIDWLCKLRAFVLFVSRNIGAWLIQLATIDR